jgi:hypothetical protein
MRIVRDAIHPKVLEGLVYEGLLDTQRVADLIYTELLLIEQYRDPGFQVARDGVWRHYSMYVNKSLISSRESNPGMSRGSTKKIFTFPHNYEKRCKLSLSLLQQSTGPQITSIFLH